MLVTLAGIVRLVMGDPIKAPVGIVVIPELIVRLVRLVQEAKAKSPRVVTLLGMMTFLKDRQKSNAVGPMQVTPSGHGHCATNPSWILYLAES